MWKGVDIIEGEICPAPIRLLLRIPPNRKKHCGNITVHKKQIMRDKKANRLSIFDPGVKKMHGCQANQQRACAWPIASGAYPKRKFPHFAGA